MGRRKIDIEFIREDRSRATTFIKRKSGLFKKAHELAILTGSQVAVVVFSQQDKVFTYSNEPCSEICSKFIQVTDVNESKGPQDYSANQENEDDSEDDVYPQANARKGSVSGHGRSDSGSSHKIVAASPKAHSRKNSTARTTPALASPKTDSAAFTTQDNGRRSPSQSSNKRGSPSTSYPRHDSPKFPKHEHVPRELSDVRSSPHQPVRPRTAPITKTTPPMMQNPHFPQAQTQTQQDLIPTQQQYMQQAMMMPGQVYLAQQDQMQHQQRQQQDQNIDHSQRIRFQEPDRQIGNSSQQQQHRPDYPTPPYGPPTTSTRQLPMAPPLTIPTNAYSGQGSNQPPGQPLLPPGIGNSGNSRVLLPGEGSMGSTGLTPIESPSNFASSLYSNSGISGIGTNISMPRISTDVGSLFYNWQTNEPGLSPATSMMLNQFREGDNNNNNNNGAATAGSNGNNSRGPSSGQTSGGVSAGVLENFSPITAQWLSGHSIPVAPQPGENKP